MINEVLTAPEEGFKVEGMDVRILLRLSFFMFTVVKLKCLQVGMVVVCGKVNVVERAATKTTYHLEDHSGTLEVRRMQNRFHNAGGHHLEDAKLVLKVVQWVDEGSAGAEHNEVDEVKVS